MLLLAKVEILTLDKAIATMIQEESRVKLLSNTTELPGVRSALMVSKSSGVKIENATIVVKWVT